MPQCPICLENLKNGSTVRLNCNNNHYVCRTCLTAQLQHAYQDVHNHQDPGNYDKCPICRGHIMTTDGAGTLNDYIQGTLANLVIITIGTKGLGVELTDDDLA